METIGGFLTPYIFVGEEGILIEGIRRIVKWEESCIEVALLRGRVAVEGKGLRLEHKTLDSMLVTGHIHSLAFGRRS